MARREARPDPALICRQASTPGREPQGAPLAAEVDDHRDEVACSKLLVSSEEVLVETDDVGPRVETLPPLELEVPVERGVQETSRATEVPTNLLQIAVELASAKPRSPIAFRVTRSFANAKDRLGEGFLTGLAP